MFATNKRHSSIYAAIQAEIENRYFSRSTIEIKNNMSNLKQMYQKHKPKSGGKNPTWIYFNDMDIILGGKAKYSDENDDSLLLNENDEIIIEEDNEIYATEFLEDVPNYVRQQYGESSCASDDSVASSSIVRHQYGGESSCHIDDTTTEEPPNKKKKEDRKSRMTTLLQICKDNNDHTKRLVQLEEEKEQRSKLSEQREEREDARNDLIAAAFIKFLEK